MIARSFQVIIRRFEEFFFLHIYIYYIGILFYIKVGILVDIHIYSLFVKNRSISKSQERLNGF